MISIFVFYSPDRRKSFDAMIYSLKKTNLYDKCQKLLIVDGSLKEKIDNDFEQIEVPRINGKFCWANMWNAGVFSSKYEILWYLDCDRILPTQYLNSALDYVADNVFVFTSNHYLMLQEMTPEDVFQWSNMSDEYFFSGTMHVGKFAYEPRYSKLLDGPGKNVMSGNTIFTKNTYLKLGGVDHWYKGHGAFADTDFHFKAKLLDCKFIDLMHRELHYFHEKFSDDNQALTKKELNLMSLNNYVYFLKKWNLSKILFDNMSNKCSISLKESEEIWNNVVI